MFTATHVIKFGADIRFSQQNAFRDVESRGRLQFSPFGQITGNALGDLLLGFPLLTSVARVDNPQHIRTQSYNFFINDSFRIRRNLTLTGGLRYEYNTPAVDAQDRANVYDINTGTLVQVGTNSVPRSGFEADKNNFAPRVGFAWTVGKARKQSFAEDMAFISISRLLHQQKRSTSIRLTSTTTSFSPYPACH